MILHSSTSCSSVPVGFVVILLAFLGFSCVTSEPVHTAHGAPTTARQTPDIENISTGRRENSETGKQGAEAPEADAVARFTERLLEQKGFPVTVRVVSTTGEPASGATLRYWTALPFGFGCGSICLTARVPTDDDGTISFPIEYEGVHSIGISAVGYPDTSVNTWLGISKSPIEIELDLRQHDGGTRTSGG